MMPDEQPIPADSIPETPEPAQALPGSEVSEQPCKILPHEEPPAMLDVHPAPHAASTWREFFIHIATIVLGLFIAVSLEQTVELLHHRHQRHQLEEELHRDGEANEQYIKDNIAFAQSIMDWALQQAAAIEHARPTGPLRLDRMPAGSIYRPDAGVWLAAKANGQASLLPTGEQNWFDDLDLVQNQLFVSNASSTEQLDAAYGALDQVVVGQAIATPSSDLDLSTLDPAQRQAVVERLRSIAEQTRVVMRSLLSYLDDDEYILSTPGDQLDTPQAMNQYLAIARKNMDAYPDLKYTFSPK